MYQTLWTFTVAKTTKSGSWDATHFEQKFLKREDKYNVIPITPGFQMSMYKLLHNQSFNI